MWSPNRGQRIVLALYPLETGRQQAVYTRPNEPSVAEKSAIFCTQSGPEQKSMTYIRAAQARETAFSAKYITKV
ncbi:hypothetical protein DM791_09095 [Paenarthrobacter nitroguajacolicus]|nr:hypothetical protein [Paenarthrobacter nitroguajacolicus]